MIVPTVNVASTAPLMELNRLRRHFGSTRAVDDVSFEVHRGQVFGYIGPNGAGKTTSMRILATLDTPNSGDAYVDGFSVVDDPDRVRRRLGFMPDYFGTYSNINVREYLDFFARAYGLRGQARLSALDYVMKFTLLADLAEKPINGLSKGMKQRLCLGRTMIHSPVALVLDEPAAGLDPRARIELREMINALAADGKAILVSSHILTELAEMCDTVGIIEQGRLLAVGTVEEIQQGKQQLGSDGRQQNAVSVEVLENADGLARWLTERGDVAELKIDGAKVSFLHPGDRAAEADLLKAMVEGGFRVASFGSRPKSLEDVFMEVTRGRVQ
jgi:ABC-2 type transport system ATP-binding protein